LLKRYINVILQIIVDRWDDWWVDRLLYERVYVR